MRFRGFHFLCDDNELPDYSDGGDDTVASSPEDNFEPDGMGDRDFPVEAPPSDDVFAPNDMGDRETPTAIETSQDDGFSPNGMGDRDTQPAVATSQDDAFSPNGMGDRDTQPAVATSQDDAFSPNGMGDRETQPAVATSQDDAFSPNGMGDRETQPAVATSQDDGFSPNGMGDRETQPAVATSQDDGFSPNGMGDRETQPAVATSQDDSFSPNGMGDRDTQPAVATSQDDAFSPNGMGDRETQPAVATSQDDAFSPNGMGDRETQPAVATSQDDAFSPNGMGDRETQTVVTDRSDRSDQADGLTAGHHPAAPIEADNSAVVFDGVAGAPSGGGGQSIVAEPAPQLPTQQEVNKMSYDQAFAAALRGDIDVKPGENGKPDTFEWKGKQFAIVNADVDKDGYASENLTNQLLQQKGVDEALDKGPVVVKDKYGVSYKLESDENGEVTAKYLTNSQAKIISAELAASGAGGGRGSVNPASVGTPEFAREQADRAIETQKLQIRTDAQAKADQLNAKIEANGSYQLTAEEQMMSSVGGAPPSDTKYTADSIIAERAFNRGVVDGALPIANTVSGTIDAARTLINGGSVDDAATAFSAGRDKSIAEQGALKQMKPGAYETGVLGGAGVAIIATAGVGAAVQGIRGTVAVVEAAEVIANTEKAVTATQVALNVGSNALSGAKIGAAFGAVSAADQVTGQRYQDDTLGTAKEIAAGAQTGAAVGAAFAGGVSAFSQRGQISELVNNAIKGEGAPAQVGRAAESIAATESAAIAGSGAEAEGAAARRVTYNPETNNFQNGAEIIPGTELRPMPKVGEASAAVGERGSNSAAIVTEESGAVRVAETTAPNTGLPPDAKAAIDAQAGVARTQLADIKVGEAYSPEIIGETALSSQAISSVDSWNQVPITVTKEEALNWLKGNGGKNYDDALKISSDLGWNHLAHGNDPDYYQKLANVVLNQVEAPVTPFAYHGTSSSVLPSIEKTGLNNSFGVTTNPGVMADGINGVTRTGDPAYANSFAQSAATVTKSDPVLLRWPAGEKISVDYIGIGPAVQPNAIQVSKDGGKTWEFLVPPKSGGGG